MFDAEQRAQAQANQIAAQQQAMMYQQAAGERDMALRNAYGQQNAWMQFGMQGAQDERNFAQAKEQDEWRAAMEDKQFENRLNAQGKAEKAKWEQQRAAVEGYRDKLKPDQFERAMAEVDAGFAKIKNPRFLMPDPPSMEEWAEKNVLDMPDKGLMIVTDDDGKRHVTQSRLAAIKEADATRKENAKLAEETKREIAKQNAELARLDRLDKMRIARMNARQKFISDHMSNADVPNMAQAERDADAFLDKEDQRQQSELDDWDTYRDWAEQQGARTLPEWDDLSERDQRAYRREIRQMKGAKPVAAPPPASTTPPYIDPQVFQSLTPAQQEAYRRLDAVPGQPAPQAAPQGQGAGAPAVEFAQSAPLVTTKQELEELKAEARKQGLKEIQYIGPDGKTRSLKL